MESSILDALPTSRLKRPPSSLLSLEEVDRRVAWLRANAVEKSTKIGYSTGARSYVSFCTKFNLPLDPTPETLSRYIAYTSQSIASSGKYLSGARYFLRAYYPDFDANRAHPLVQTVLRGSRKVRADPVKRKPPLRTRHLSLFVQMALTSQAYDDILFATMLVCCFFGCHRSGELFMSSNSSLLDMRKVIKRATLHFNDGRAGYRLPYHKGDPFYRGTDILFMPMRDFKAVCPVSLLSLYSKRRDKLHRFRAALFLKEDGELPSRAWFERRFFASVGREFGGHSARAGGATFYAQLGLSEDVIQALGRWSSSAWKIYIRDNPTIRAELQIAQKKMLPP